ncbi:MAG TPA: Lrp/AsnC family transcriptional regulator [Gammaproteobacteria bacterium]|nr:Lrp/AsnC family transcriptional regulator [Gammaproteobacteria bacterium]
MVLKDAATSPEAARFSEVEKRLLNDFQRGFPLVNEPFRDIANQLKISEQQVLDTLCRFHASGLISRVGPVFSPNIVGRSTLAAMAVPEQDLESIAEVVNAFAEVNHNYERDHRFNLWFVITAQDQHHLNSVLVEIEQQCALPVMSLPMLESFHIDLGFSLDWDKSGDDPGIERPARLKDHVDLGTLSEFDVQTDSARRLIAAVQHGLPLVSQPYAAIAEQADMDEAEVLAYLQSWLEAKVVNRLGIILRHRKLGYKANAMVVWDVPDDDIARLGQCFSEHDFVTLCYRRPRQLPQWPYNLFCMIHGQDHDAVLDHIAGLAEQCADVPVQHEVLFSRRCFKQRGAHYHKASQSSCKQDS